MDYAIELGHTVLAYTEHETVANYLDIEDAYNERKKEHPELKIIRGNEIYLVRNGLNKDNFNPEEDRYWHFILLARNLSGNEQIREISTRAWMRSYMARGMRRVPTYYQDLIDIIYHNQGNVIGSTACLGGYSQQLLVKYIHSKNEKYLQQCKKWLLGMKKLFGEGNFFLEMQPSINPEEIFVCKEFLKLSKELNIPYIITNDAHYLKKSEEYIHAAYLKSQNGDRETSEFYATAFLMGTEELESYFDFFTEEQLEIAYKNIQIIADSCEDYTLEKPLHIPELPWKDSYVTEQEVIDFEDKIPNFKYLMESDFHGDNLLGRMILQGIKEDKTLQNQQTYDEVNLELDLIYQSSIVNKAHWSSYFLNLQKMLDVVWEAGSIVMCGRGSGVGFLILYILGITQINPLRETTKLYPWRFLNPERVSVLDVDVDVSGLRRRKILDHFREVYGEDRICNVLTLGTEKSKSAILTAARGLGISNDIAQYIASLIPSDRGLIRSLHQCYYGDDKNDFKPVAQFVAQIKQYPKLWKVAQRIEGLVCRMGIHAGGLVLVDEPFTKSAALMRAPDGTIISAFDLHKLERESLIKYDLLSVNAADKIQTCLELLVKYGYVKKYPTLKETYEHTIGIYNLERNNIKMWKMIWDHKIQSLFQMEKSSGIQGIALTHPKSVDDLAILNAAIRLMAQDNDAEQPLHKYARFKNNINEWYKEMDQYGLTKEEQELLKPILSISYGMCIGQEQFMMLVQIPECGGFDLNFADRLRKSIAKKKPEQFKQCEKEYFDVVKKKHLSENLCNYVWNVLVMTSRGYGFNLSHTLAYSLIGLQEMNLAYKYPIIFWNCANLIVDSGTLDTNENETSDYNKIARAVNKIKFSGINISLININTSEISFTPDVENNTINYGLGGVQGISNDSAREIINNRPYSSFEDFLSKTNLNRTVIIALIKAGAFNEFGEATEVMKQYLWLVCNPKTRITMQNFNGLIEHNLIPQELKLEKQIFNFNKMIKKACKYDQEYFALDKNDIYRRFYEKYFDSSLLETKDDHILISKKNLKKQYDKYMLKAKQYIQEHQKKLLQQFNNKLFQDQWDKYAQGYISCWEVETLGMYYHSHELSNINLYMFGLSNYKSIPQQPIVDRKWKRGDREIPIYKIFSICGTIVAKDEMHGQITIVTPDNQEVTVKMSKDYFSRCNAQISEKQPDGTKKVIERGWLQRSNKIICRGFNRDGSFVLRTYRHKGKKPHMLELITEINKNGTIKTTGYRYGENQEEDR